MLDLKTSEDWRIKEAIRLCDPRSSVPFHEFLSAVGRIVENARGEAADPATVLESDSGQGDKVL